jgi:uncharacterized protein
MKLPPWILSMEWHDLCFMHWAVPPESLRNLIPADLELDLYQGKAWIGLVPFHMAAVCPRATPRWKWLSDFPEMNVRTYVKDKRSSGVWFFSLDATQPLAVWAARTFFSLPYRHASIDCYWDHSNQEPWHYYSSRVEEAGQGSPDERPCFAGRYRPTEAALLSQPGTLEYFLSERYWLFAQRGSKTLKARIHHVPWPLQKAEVEIQSCHIMERYGIRTLPDTVHFAKKLFVSSWPLQNAE